MDKYLLLLLKEVNTIIIPDLGALTITNHSTGEIMFMPFLKYDDGKLATYISEKEGFELNDSKNLISKYVRDVQAVLDRGESYDMFQFGTFLKDKSGEIIFRNWDGSMPSEIKNELLANQIVEEIISLEDSDSTKEEHESIQESLEQEIKINSKDSEVNSTEETSESYQNDIEGITINSNKDLEINIGEKHILAVRNEGNIELLKDGVLLENYADFLPKSEIVKPLVEVKEKKNRSAIDQIVEIKEEINIPEVIAPIQTESVFAQKPKAELTPAELEAKRIKNAEREADRERRLSERMEKLAMKGMPEETKEEGSPKNELVKEKVKPSPTPKKEKEVKEPKRAFVVQKTPNQKSSILIAISIISIGLIGGLGIILYNSGDISAPKLVAPKELAENNKNIEPTEDISSLEESSSTVVVETAANSEEVFVPAMEDKASSSEKELKPTVKSFDKPKPTTKQASVVSAPVKSSSEGKYHIVGGSFSVKVNAENFVNQMIAKGLDAKLLGKIDKMYIVSIGSYTSKREAITESKTIGVKGWIFKQN
jgi:hypothetical protein